MKNHLSYAISFIAISFVTISLYFSLTSYKNHIDQSSIKKLIVGEWVIYEAYNRPSFDYDCNEQDLSIDTSLIGKKWIFKEDGTCCFVIGRAFSGKWGIEDNQLSIECEGTEVLETYMDEDSNELVTDIVNFGIGYNCDIKHFEKNRFSISGIYYDNHWLESIHENGDTIYQGMPPEYDECIKYSFVRIKTN